MRSVSVAKSNLHCLNCDLTSAVFCPSDQILQGVEEEQACDVAGVQLTFNVQQTTIIHVEDLPD